MEGALKTFLNEIGLAGVDASSATKDVAIAMQAAAALFASLETVSTTNRIAEMTPASSVQISADSDEIHRRITTFIAKKREEINQSNRQEFTMRTDSDDEASARTHAASINRDQQMKSSIVYNRSGPQSNPPPAPTVILRDGLVDRIHGLESHVHLPLSPVPSDVYVAIKRLEDRLLVLERATSELAANPALPSPELVASLMLLTSAPVETKSPAATTTGAAATAPSVMSIGLPPSHQGRSRPISADSASEGPERKSVKLS